MSEFCLKYERVRTEYNEVCEMIGRYLSDEEMYFDFEKKLYVLQGRTFRTSL